MTQAPASAGTTSGLSHDELKALCVRSIHMMGDGNLSDFEAVFHSNAHNREAEDEPPACRGAGPAAFFATALWLRSAYADLQWDIHDVVVDGDLVVVHATMSGRQVGTFVGYGPDGMPAQAFPARNKTFGTTQTHWLRVADGKVIEHWANRDDLGTAAQLGWVPPSPVYVFKMMLATRKARRQASKTG